MAPGLPYLVTPLSPPSAVTRLPAAQQLAALARGAARPDAKAKLLYGLALWNLRRPVSAEREFTAAAALAPHDPVAQTAAAVGSFSKDRPVTAFARLGRWRRLSRCYEGTEASARTWLEVASVAYLFARLRVEPA
jgi:hypothetical protein